MVGFSSRASQLLRSPPTGLFLADLAAAAQQDQQRMLLPSGFASSFLPQRTDFSRRSPSPPVSVASSSDTDDAPASKKARTLDEEEEESGEESNVEEDNVRQSQDPNDSIVKDEGDAASEAGSSNESIGSDRTITENNAGVLSCEVTIHTGEKPSDVSPSPAAIIVVTPSN